MSKSIESKIQCPFYLEEGESFIKCEGLLDHTCVIQNFSDNAAKRDYELNTCSVNGGKGCYYYRSLHLYKYNDWYYDKYNI